LIDLFDQQERERGLTKMQRLFNKGQSTGKGKVTTIICGGDGTVLWVISLVGKQGIDLTKVTFCIVPIGTGNDFSRCLGWGGSPISFSAGKLNQLKERLL
jgi:diacylglycerol kinase (ATP)